jgi:hypothetical protein
MFNDIVSNKKFIHVLMKDASVRSDDGRSCFTASALIHQMLMSFQIERGLVAVSLLSMLGLPDHLQSLVVYGSTDM